MCFSNFNQQNFHKQGPFSTFQLPKERDCEWTSLKFSADGKTILLTTNGNIIRLIDAFTGQLKHTLSVCSVVSLIVWKINQEFFFCFLFFFCRLSPHLIKGFANTTNMPIEASFSPDAQFVFCGELRYTRI